MKAKKKTTTNIMLISFMAMRVPRTVSRRETDTGILFISGALSRCEFAILHFPNPAHFYHPS